MEQIPFPSNIAWKPGNQEHEEIVTIEPCYPGYGVTLGNAIRRVLLSSLPGAAVVAVKIDGVLHEFSTLDHVKEDSMSLILNLKNIRLKMHEVEEARLYLKASGIKTVTAGDIAKNASVEIVNPEAVIATLTDKKAKLDMEIVVRRGRGYLAVEDRGHEEQREIGNIMIDALFSPVVNVGLKVEDQRVGEMTNYERLVLTILTDGILTPQEAFLESVEILIQQFESLKGSLLPAIPEVVSLSEIGKLEISESKADLAPETQTAPLDVKAREESVPEEVDKPKKKREKKTGK